MSLRIAHAGDFHLDEDRYFADTARCLEWFVADAILASLTSACRRHDVDPQLYLTQLLVNLPTWPVRDLDAWLPDRWKLRHAARLATSISKTPPPSTTSRHRHPTSTCA